MLEIASSPEGPDPLMYIVRWEKPRTGGLPIIKYQFKFRPVSTYAHQQQSVPKQSPQRGVVSREC